MQRNSVNGNDKDLNDFFQLYSVFLTIDSVDSIIYGRNRELIQSFYNFYLRIINKENIIESRKKLRDECKRYMELKRDSRIDLKIPTIQDSKYINIIKNPNITESFKELSIAVATYRSWRDCLNNEQIKTIYIANLKDRQKYYFSVNKIIKF